MLAFEQVTKRFGNRIAVSDLSFTAEAGEILGILGPNGAGKTTTLRLLTSYLLPTSGRVTVFGYDTAVQPLEVRRRIGYLPEEPPIYPEMTVREYMTFVARAKGVPARRCRAHVDDVLERVGLAEVSGRLLANLSRGYRQRAGIGQALLGDPDLLVLDEPTVGLDPVQVIEIRDLIRELGRERTVIFSSHILPEVQALCSRVIIITRGRIVAQDTPEGLSRRLQGGWRYLIEADGPADEVAKVLAGLPGVTETERREGEAPERPAWLVSSGDRDIRRDLFFALAEAGLPLLRLEPQRLSLEEVFLQLVTDETGGETTGEAADAEGGGDGGAAPTEAADEAASAVEGSGRDRGDAEPPAVAGESAREGDGR